MVAYVLMYNPWKIHTLCQGRHCWEAIKFEFSDAFCQLVFLLLDKKLRCQVLFHLDFLCAFFGSPHCTHLNSLVRKILEKRKVLMCRWLRKKLWRKLGNLMNSCCIY